MPSRYNLEAGRSKKQVENMQELEAEGKCFMCYETLKGYENNRIEFETDHWVITENSYPYKNTTLHMILIAKRHVRALSDLTKAERADLTEAAVQVEQRWKLDSYALCMRNGDMRYNGASVDHLHAHIIVGERDPKLFEKVRFKVSSLPGH
jgi:ATP adenylyltransferase